MNQYFPKPYGPFGRDINVKVDVSNYEIKTDIKNNSHVDTPIFALKLNLVSLKIELDKLDVDKLNNLKNKVDKLDIDPLTPVPVDLSK